MVLRRIFRPKRKEITEERRKLHNEQLHDLNFSPDTAMIKSRKMRWTGHIERRFCYENSKGRNRLEDVGVDRRVILKTDLKEIKWENED
jgi:hypothetical protein